MSTEFTLTGIIFMITAWSSILGITIFALRKVLKKNKLSE